MKFYIFVAGFILSIFVCSFLKIDFDLAIFLLVFSSLVFVFARFLAGERKKIVLLTIFLFGIALGVIRYDLKDTRDKNVEEIISHFIGQKVTLIGIVVDEPNVTEKTAQLTVQTETIQKTNIAEKVLVVAPLFPQFKYGDKIRAEGKLELPKNFISTSTPDFDYIGYLAKDDIFYELSFANVYVISSDHGSWLKIKLFEFKDAFMDRINSLIKEPESSLLGGLLLGAKNSLGKEWQNNFRKAGVSHIVALSGYNITIVAEGIMLALSFLPRFVAMSFGAFGIILFTIMTGASATSLRASSMALLVLLAKATGRTYDVVRALALALLFMLVQNPKVLVFDISFQLSFLSTIALIFFSPIIEQKFIKSVWLTRQIKRLPEVLTKKAEKIKLGELILATISTQIFVLPFIFYKMGMISLVSLPTNLLILPLIPTIMLVGFITGMVALVFSFLPFIAIPFAFISSLLLSYVLKVIQIFADLPFSSLNIKNFPLVVVILIYTFYLAVIWRYQIGARRRTS